MEVDVVTMKHKIFYTILTVKECQNILLKETRRLADRFLNSEKTKYVGGFRDNDFWLTTSAMTVFFGNSGMLLQGIIIGDYTHRIIQCRFGIKVTFMLLFSIKILIALTLISLFPRLLLYGIANYLSAIASYICLLLVVNIFGYCFAYYRYTALLKFAKDLFNCEESIDELKNKQES